MPTGFPFSTHFKLCNVFFLFLLPHYLILQHAALSEPPTGLFQKNCFSFFKYRRVQSSGGSEQQQLSVNGSFVSVWRCLLEASYSPAPGSARSPVFSLNVNIRPHLAPGESHTSHL